MSRLRVDVAMPHSVRQLGAMKQAGRTSGQAWASAAPMHWASHAKMWEHYLLSTGPPGLALPTASNLPLALADACIPSVAGTIP